jgi:hypothetical protein
MGRAKSLFFAGILSAALGGVAAAQTVAVKLQETPLLPQSFGEWKTASPPIANPNYTLLLANVSKAALEEDNPQRSSVVDYFRLDHGAAKTVHIEAVQFDDRTGAYSAFTLVEQPGMRVVKDLGDNAAVGNGAVLFAVGSSVVLVNGADANDVAALKPLVEAMPKPAGNKGIAPLLPTFAPEKGLVASSVRYAVGPATYAAEGGVLPAQSLGWDKSGEALTAKYNDKRGQETLTIMVYPTPAIAGSFMRLVEGESAGMGPSFANAKVRREGELVMLANGTFSPDEAQKMIENIHMHQELSFDKDVQPVFHTEVQKTFSLLQAIALLFAVLGGTAVALGLILGFGRAGVRVLMGKPAAVEIEFLSLHLAPQNAAPRIGPDDPTGGLPG